MHLIILINQLCKTSDMVTLFIKFLTIFGKKIRNMVKLVAHGIVSDQGTDFTDREVLHIESTGLATFPNILKQLA